MQKNFLIFEKQFKISTALQFPFSILSCISNLALNEIILEESKNIDFCQLCWLTFAPVTFAQLYWDFI